MLSHLKREGHEWQIFLTLQLKGSGAELSRRVQNLLTLSRFQADGLIGGSVYLPGSTKIHEQSLADMQEVRVKLILYPWDSSDFIHLIIMITYKSLC